MSSLSLPEKVTRRRKASRESHPFQKHSSTSASTTSSSSFPSDVSGHRQHHHLHPVITYTQAPKIIHTSPSEFMALVQKLTGLSREDVTNAADHAAADEAKVMIHVEDADHTLQCSPEELWSSSLCAIAAKNECYDMGFMHLDSVDSYCSLPAFYPSIDELELDLVLDDANFMMSNFSWKP